MLRASSSLLPSTSPADERLRQPRKVLQPETPENEERSAPDLNNDSGSTNASGIPLQNGSSGPASASVQEGDGVQGAEQFELPEDGERGQPIFSTPETIHYSLESDADSGNVDSEVKQTDHTVTSVTTTTTKVEERKTTDVQKAEQSANAREETVQPRQDASTFSSRTTSGQQRYEVRSSIQGGVQRKTSFYQETRFPPVTEAGQSPVTYSSPPMAPENRRFKPPSNSTYSSVQELLQIERLHREEKDRILALITRMTTEHEEYKHFCEEEFNAFETENARLVREMSASASRIILLEIQLSSRGDSHPGTASQHEVDSNITTITTSITTITTTITTVTTRIEQWKHRNKGQITISSKELEQLSLDLSTTSSQMTELQQHYAKLSGDFSSVRYELQLTLSLRDEKDRTITSLTAEVAQWKNADAAKAQQITAVRRDNETLRRDLSAASSRTAELQQRHDAQLSEHSSTRNELQTKASLIEERDRTITSITAEVARWKQSDATKAEQIATARRDYEKLQRDHSATSSGTAELQERYDAQSKELGSVRSELQANKSLVEEKDRTITTLTAEVDQWKRVDTTKGEQFAAEHRDKEKLQRDLEAFSSQTTDLRKRYDAQSEDIVSTRNELQTKISLLEENERTITSLTTEVAQAKREDSVKAEQIVTARRDVEQLRGELSSASSRIADLQKRYEAQLEELHRIEILYPDGTDQTPGEPSENAPTQHITRALEKKKKQMEELRRDLATSTSRNTELQKSYEALSKEVSAVRDELKVKTSQNEGTITSLTAQVDQWKRADATKAEQIATTLKQVEKLQQDLSTSTTQLAELQRHYEAQSREFITTRNELQTRTSFNEGKDRTIASLTAEVDQWKRSDANQAEQIATTLKQVENLQRDLSASTSKLAELQGRYEAQSRELISVRKELQTGASLHEGKDHTIASLSTELDQWKRADAAKAEQIATTIKQVEKLQRDLSASTSQLAELQGRYKAQSYELVSVRNELTSSNEGKDRTVAALTAQVEEWKRTDALKEERIMTTRKQAEDLQRDLTSSSSQITELQLRYEVQSRELNSIRDQLQDTKDHTVSSLIIQVEEWKSSDATKAGELTIAHKDLDQLRRDLATSSSQIEGWKRSDATRTEELTAARNDLERLGRDLSVSSSQIIEYQQRSAAQSAELTSRIEQWKRSDAAKAEELATARQKLEQLQHDLSTSSSRITEFQQRYEAQSTELSSLRGQLHATSSLGRDKDQTVVTLNAQIEQWKRADASKAEELAHAHGELEQLQCKLTSVESREVYERITTEVKDYASIIKLTTTVDEWLRADGKRAEELALELAKRNKENEELRKNLITLKEIYIRAPELKQIFHSETIEIQSYVEKSRRLESALAECQSQLHVVQRFVTTADTYADTAIIQELQKLNAEVQQSTTFMAECIVEDFRPRVAKPTKEQISAAQKVSESIGQTLAGCLGKKERDDVALYLPIAFQAYLTYYLGSIISSWTIEKGYNDRINEIYDQLQKSEAQTMSGRWRSLTRAYISPTCMSDPNILIAATVEGLSNIVVAAGCASSPSSAKSKVSSKFRDRVSSIISIAGKFSKMIGEVVSADFEVLAVRPVQMFEETTMEEDVDDYDKGQGIPGGTATGQKVLCPTHLGMTKRTELESGKKNTLTVIKAKVVLESFVDG